MSSPSNAVSLLLIYSISLSLALFLGYALAVGGSFETLGIISLVAAALCAPLVLRGHRAMLFLSWNSTLGLFFLPGQSPFWISLSVLSLVVTLVDRTLNRGQQLVNAPTITWPLAVFAMVVVITMLARGGLGIQWMGSGALSGGRKYIWVLGACLGYFALTGQGIPIEKARLYCGLFFLGGLTGFVGPVMSWLGGSFAYLQYVFDPVEGVAESDQMFRVKGFSITGSALVAWMLSRYGFGGVFHSGHFWRAGLFVFGTALGMLSGYRTAIASYALTLVLLFFMEGHHRTPRLLAWVGTAMLGVALLIPLTPHLPTPIQRSLAFLPLPVDAIVRQNAESTVEWRQGLWGALLSDVPQYFWLGKGLTISTVDMEWASTISRFGADQWYYSYLTGEHHNGFLSVMISFGIWGVMAFFWLLVAGLTLLLRNSRFGRVELQSVNTYLLASYISWMVMFFSYSGTLYWQMKDIAGWLALSVALNGGMLKRGGVASNKQA